MQLSKIEATMYGDALAAVTLRNDFYRTGRRRAIVIFLVSLLTNLMLAFLLGYLLLNPPAPQYFPISINGHIVTILPLSQPNQADDLVLSWTSEAALASFSYSYVDYREELQASSGFFTARGWTQFLNALQASNNLIAVKSKDMVVTAQLINPPTILKKDVVNGVFTWRIAVPILVTYQNNTEYTQQYNMVTLQVIRVSTLNAPRGIGIDQLVVSPITNGSS
jgi:intracellular multiplication protein IcmL